MDREDKEKILTMIKEIEKKNLHMEEYISNLSILSRKYILKEITQDIIENNLLLQEIIGTKEKIISKEKIDKNNSFNQIIEGYLNKIEEAPHKNVIFLIDCFEHLMLRGYLDLPRFFTNLVEWLEGEKINVLFVFALDERFLPYFGEKSFFMDQQSMVHALLGFLLLLFYYMAG